MRANAVFDLLPDFGARAVRAEANARPQPPAVEHMAPAVDTDAIVAAAVARAETALEARLRAEHEGALEAWRKAHAEESTAFLSTLGSDVGKTIASHLDALEGRVADLVGGQAARILGTVLADDLQRRAIAALARIIGETTGDAEAVRVRVSGPLSLYETLREALGPHGQNLDFVEAPGFDLTATVDDAVFETRMSEWSQALSEILS